MRLERVVPAGASLTYSVNGVPVETKTIPKGRVSITVVLEPAE